MPGLIQHPVTVPEMSSFEEVRQAISNVFNQFQQSLHNQFPLTNFQGKRISNVAPPTAADDVVTLKYLQSNQPSQRNSVNPFQQQPSGSGGSNLWTQNNQFLYPTATFTTCVIVGAASSDFFGGPGQLATTAAIGMMTGQTNASLVYLFISPGIETQLVSNKSGTGTLLPLSLYCNGLRATIQTTGEFIVGSRTSDAGGAPGRIIATSSVSVVSATTNASTVSIGFNGTTESILASGNTGTGTLIPLSFYTNNVRAATITTGNALLVGFLTSDFANQAGQITASVVVSVASAATNATTIDFHINGTTETLLVSSKTGTGTFLPLSFYTNNVRQVTITVGGAMLLGILTSDAAAINRVITIDRFVCVTAATNASSMFMGVTAGTESFLASGSTGTGTNLPISFYLANSTRQLAITVNGEMIAGGSVAIGNFPQRGRFITIASGDFLVTTALTGASSWFQFAINPGTSCNIQSNQSVSGTQLPIWFVIGGVFAAGVDTNRAFLVGITTSDLSNGGGEIIALTEVAVITAATNASVIRLIQTAGTANFIQSTVTGTGTSLPIAFTFGGTEAARYTTAGAYLVGLTSTDFSNSAGQITASLAVSVVSAATNATTIDFHINGTTETLLVSSKTGTGTFLPLSFYTNNVRAWTIDNSGVLIGGSVNNGSYGAITGRILTKGDVIITTGFTGNESYVRMEIASSLSTIESGAIGTGTTLPLTFNVATGSEKGRFATNGAFLVGFTSSDASSAGSIISSAVQAVVSAATNATTIAIQLNGTTETVLQSGATGTGTMRPLSFYTNNTRAVTIDTTGTLNVGFLSTGAPAAGRVTVSGDFLCLSNGTANASFFQMGIQNSATQSVLNSSHIGTGTDLPICFQTASAERMRILAGGKVLINRTTDDGTGAQLQVAGTISSNGTVITVP